VYYALGNLHWQKKSFGEIGDWWGKTLVYSCAYTVVEAVYQPSYYYSKHVWENGHSFFLSLEEYVASLFIDKGNRKEWIVEYLVHNEDVQFYWLTVGTEFFEEDCGIDLKNRGTVCSNQRLLLCYCMENTSKRIRKELRSQKVFVKELFRYWNQCCWFSF